MDYAAIMRMSDEDFEHWVAEETRKGDEAFAALLNQEPKEQSLAELLEEIKNAPIPGPAHIFMTAHELRDLRKMFKEGGS